MRSPAARILSEYRTLLIKMGADMKAGGCKPAADNFDLLSDVEVLLSLACFIPLINAVHCLIKFSQARDIFICDFLQAVKLCEEELARMFLNASTAFSKQDFPCYTDLVSLSYTEVPLLWRPLPGDSGICYLMFVFGQSESYARCHNKETGVHLFVTQEEYNRLQDNIECQFSEIAQSLSDEIDRRFPHHALLDAFGIIYPQYWRDGAEESFQHHLAVLKEYFSTAKVVKRGEPFLAGGKLYIVPEMLSASHLENQQHHFMVTMKSNAKAACGPLFHTNLVIKLWRKLDQSLHLCKFISEYFKLAEIGCCLLLGLVEDERCFSTFKFLKSCQRDRLGKHLPLVVRLFGQKYFSLENFPYMEAIELWKKAVKTDRQGDA